jgi:DNA-binding NtrC family response regulator
MSLSVDQALPRRFRLRGTDLAHTLEPGTIPVGSAPTNRLVLPAEGVSRHHALLQVGTDRVVVIDNRSKNGTFVNGRPIGRAEIDVGDVVAFGPMELRLEGLAPEDVELALTISPPHPPTPLHDRTTKPVHRSRRDKADRWLRLIRSFMADLAATPGCCALALSRLARELGVAGACLLTLDDAGRHETVIASAGDVDPETLREWLDQLPLGDAENRSSPGDGLLISGPQATGFLAPASGGFAALVVLGDFGGRDETGPLFSTLVDLIRKLMPIPRFESGSPTQRERPKLRFPEGYVRGVSPAMEQLYRVLEGLVQGDLPVLIRGETGAGKELVAQILHLSSSRGEGPFVAINCAAIPADLLEAELFGIGGRVATGVAARRGQFLEARGGTLFLDEISEMPVGLQAKLLRVLQERKLRPLGGAPVDVDVRLLTATNADLEARIEEGSFRRDLYFRIAGVVVRVPSLAERREDIPVLIESLLGRTARDVGKAVRGLTVGALDRLVRRAWPGNVRELEHEIRRLVYLCPPGGVIESSMISGYEAGGAATARPAPLVAAGGAAPTGDPAPSLPVLDLGELERLAIAEALRQTNDNQVRAAKLLGVSRHVLRRRLERFEER